MWAALNNRTNGILYMEIKFCSQYAIPSNSVPTSYINPLRCSHSYTLPHYSLYINFALLRIKKGKKPTQYITLYNGNKENSGKRSRSSHPWRYLRGLTFVRATHLLGASQLRVKAMEPCSIELPPPRQPREAMAHGSRSKPPSSPRDHNICL